MIFFLSLSLNHRSSLLDSPEIRRFSHTTVSIKLHRQRFIKFRHRFHRSFPSSSSLSLAVVVFINRALPSSSSNLAAVV
ncbi:hypothetical protein Bca4012_024990 [Brassica carinata]